LQAEDGILDLVRSRGLGDVYKRQAACLGQVEELLAYRQVLHAKYGFESLNMSEIAACIDG